MEKQNSEDADLEVNLDPSVSTNRASLGVSLKSPILGFRRPRMAPPHSYHSHVSSKAGVDAELGLRMCRKMFWSFCHC